MIFIGSRLIGELTDKQFYVQVRISPLLFRNNLADLGLIPSAEFALDCCLLELSIWGQRGADASDTATIRLKNKKINLSENV